MGKKISRSNALKHGIFSSVILLEGESRAQYETLLRGFREYFRPEGTPEEVLVEKLATLVWRHRRLVMAERAEIRQGVRFLNWDQENQQRRDADQIPSYLVVLEGGLIRRIENPHVLKRCLELLAELRQGIQEEGFDPERDTHILTKIYGLDGDSWRETLLATYQNWFSTAQAAEEEREREGYASPGECKEIVLREIATEIHRLENYHRRRSAIESDRTQLEALRRNVPESPRLDRLLRYEASLERAFDRTLGQLERLQRMRQGQPIPPPVKVELSHA